MNTKQLFITAIGVATTAIAMAGNDYVFYSARTSPADTAPNITTQTEQAIWDATQPGATITLGQDDMTTDLPRIPWQMTAGGPQLLFADDPEYLAEPEGIAVREVVRPGIVRIETYNCPLVAQTKDGYTTDSKLGTPLDRKLSLVIENLSKSPMTLKWKRYSYPTPSTDYLQVAKKAILGYFDENSTTPQTRVIAPEAVEVLDPAMENILVHYNELANTFHEIEISQPARISLIQCAPETPTLEAAKRAKPMKSPNFFPARGIFPFSEYIIRNAPEYIIDTARGPVQLMLNDGNFFTGLLGRDTTKPFVGCSVNSHYGVLYKCKLTYTSTDERPLAVLTWNYDKGSEYDKNIIGGLPMETPGKFEPGIIAIPSDKPGLPHVPKACLLQILPPPPKGTTATIEFTYTPPGACVLPSPIVFMPLNTNRPLQ